MEAFNAYCVKQITINPNRINDVIPEKRTKEMYEAMFDSEMKCDLSIIPDNMKTPEMCKLIAVYSKDSLKYIPVNQRTLEICKTVASHNTSFQYYEYIPEEIKNSTEFKKHLLGKRLTIVDDTKFSLRPDGTFIHNGQENNRYSIYISENFHLKPITNEVNSFEGFGKLVYECNNGAINKVFVLVYEEQDMIYLNVIKIEDLFSMIIKQDPTKFPLIPNECKSVKLNITATQNNPENMKFIGACGTVYDALALYFKY